MPTPLAGAASNAIAQRCPHARSKIRPALRIVTALAAETRQGLGGAQRNRAGPRRRCGNASPSHPPARPLRYGQ